MTKLLFFLFTIVSSFCACNEYSPKPSGYQRIDREGITWKSLENDYFSFEYPSDVQLKELPANKAGEYWFNLVYPQFEAIVYCTYMPIDKKSYPRVLDDSYRLAYSHASKADGISQSQFEDSLHCTSGIIYDIGGAVAVPVQFYVTDSVAHFLRGSLYFNTVVNRDSIAPVVQFMRKDIVRMMESLQWKRSAR